MRRTEFIRTCGFACLGGVASAALLQSCTSVKTVSGVIENDNIIVPLAELIIEKDEEIRFRKYIIVQNQQLRYPICLYRISEREYSAVQMKCTHQGQELNSYGDRLQCSAHGSEFDKYGNVNNGPATEPLRSFPVEIEKERLKISIKAS